MFRRVIATVQYECQSRLAISQPISQSRFIEPIAADQSEVGSKENNLRTEVGAAATAVIDACTLDGPLATERRDRVAESRRAESGVDVTASPARSNRKDDRGILM